MNFSILWDPDHSAGGLVMPWFHFELLGSFNVRLELFSHRHSEAYYVNGVKHWSMVAIHRSLVTQLTMHLRLRNI